MEIDCFSFLLSQIANKDEWKEDLPLFLFEQQKKRIESESEKE